MSGLMKCLLLILLTFFVFVSLCEAKKKPKLPDQSGEDQSLTSSGELSSKNGDRCTWQTREGKNNMLLQLKCSKPPQGAGLERDQYECQFTGKPNECPAYGDKPVQYWKQVVGKLKKRPSACEGSKVLKAPMCRGAPDSAHMKRLKDKAANGKDEKDGKADEETVMTMMADEAAETQNYCAEGWDPLCHFLTKILS